MKISSSYSAVFCFMMVPAFINTTWQLCDLRPFDCQHTRGYTSPTRSWRASWLMTRRLSTRWHKHSFQQLSHTFWKLRTRVCWVPSETRSPPTCNGLDSNKQTAKTETRGWNFRWSRSPVLNMIAVEQLLAFAPAESIICSFHLLHSLWHHGWSKENSLARIPRTEKQSSINRGGRSAGPRHRAKHTSGWPCVNLE